jgi:hypothetical protein
MEPVVIPQTPKRNICMAMEASGEMMRRVLAWLVLRDRVMEETERVFSGGYALGETVAAYLRAFRASKGDAYELDRRLNGAPIVLNPEYLKYSLYPKYLLMNDLQKADLLGINLEDFRGVLGSFPPVDEELEYFQGRYDPPVSDAAAASASAPGLLPFPAAAAAAAPGAASSFPSNSR